MPLGGGTPELAGGLVGTHPPCGVQLPPSSAHRPPSRPLALRPGEAPATCPLGDVPQVRAPGSPAQLLLCPPRPVMMEAENFTIFIKNSIRFPLFNFEK